MTTTPSGIGLPHEAGAFIARHSRFFETLPRLRALIERTVNRTFRPTNQAQAVIFFLARMAVEDFMEILVLAGNGYGVGSEKLLRGMFERVVTSMYLSRHPEEATLFLEYDYVNQHRLIYHAQEAGIDLTEKFTRDAMAESERQYERVKANYPGSSWNKKDLATISAEVGLRPEYTAYSFWPTLQLHTTVAGMKSRLVEDAGKLRFREGPQHEEADYALVGGHSLLAVLLEDQIRFFGLDLAPDLASVKKDFMQCWAK